MSLLNTLFILSAASKHPCAEEMFFETDKIDYIYDIINNDEHEKLSILLQTDPVCKKKIKRIFFYSIIRNAIQCAPILLTHIKNINELFFLDNCYIQAATEYNRLEITKIILQEGADPNIVTTNQCCPIGNAVRNKNIAMVNLLRQHGASIDVLIYFDYDLQRYPDVSLIKDVIDTMTVEELYVAKKYNNYDNMLHYIIEKEKEAWKPLDDVVGIEGIVRMIKSYVF